MKHSASLLALSRGRVEADAAVDGAEAITPADRRVPLMLGRACNEFGINDDTIFSWP